MSATEQPASVEGSAIDELRACLAPECIAVGLHSQCVAHPLNPASKMVSVEVRRTEAAGRIIDIMSGGNFDWRSRLEESDFLESADWLTALAYADAVLDAVHPQPAAAVAVTEADHDDQQKRRAALIERLGTVADLLCSNPLEGEIGDVAYDLLREAAARISSDRLRFDRLAHASAQPKMGPHPLAQTERPTLDAAITRLKDAYTVQQPFAQDQAALVWRWDLGAVLRELTRLTAYVEHTKSAQPATVAEGVAVPRMTHAELAALDRGEKDSLQKAQIARE